MTGWAEACDVGLHIVVLVLAFLGWIGYGPCPQIRVQTVWLSLIFPLAWLVYTLVRGASVDWYPYPFVDVHELGYHAVLLNCLGIAALLLARGGMALVADRRLPPAPGTE